MAGNFVHLILTYIDAFWTFLNWIRYAIYHRSRFQFLKKGRFELRSSHFHQNPRSKEPVECAVCLSEIKKEDEISELRCNHLFHKHCLDRCVEHRHATCLLCRDYLAGPRMVAELGRELLVFSFCSIDRSNDDDFDRWWLR
ncbi:Zinc finger, RING/FYVE/PHD-type [Cynara cardunculus var. scolymus]|uniref:Zinc finger, RING/FYVE/PHD-type n=1 Tax=Cynara cardunculus var. scolymus TaxID=59895 RepID=A0A103YA55_CYNCS|nr:Zinc finger, RING/FYVE/PHD-type [Cynara cardunculus var. scolymus]